MKKLFISFLFSLSGLLSFIPAHAVPYAIDAQKSAGALCTGSSDDTAAITRAVNYAEANGGLLVQLPTGICKVTAPLPTFAHGTSIAGNGYGTVLYANYTTNSPLIQIGTSTTVWTGYKSQVYNLQLAGNAGGGASSHGISVTGALAHIHDVVIGGFQGSGLWCTFCQYLQVDHSGFYGNARYGIELLTYDWDNGLGTNTGFNTAGSNDVRLNDIYQLIDNGMGGIFGQLSGGRLTGITTTNTGPIAITLMGYGNVIDGATLEYALADAVAHTFIQTTTWPFSTVISHVTMQGPGTNLTPIKIMRPISGQSQTIIRDVTVNASPVVANVVKADALSSVVFEGVNIWGNAQIVTDYTYGRSNCFYRSLLRAYQINLASTSGSGPYYFTYNTVTLPCYGTYKISMRSGGAGNDLLGNGGVNTGTAYYYPGINAFTNDSAFHGVGGQAATNIAAVDSYGNVEVIAENNSSSGVNTFITTAVQLGTSE